MPVDAPNAHNAMELNPIMMPVPKKLSKNLFGRFVSARGFMTASLKLFNSNASSF